MIVTITLLSNIIAINIPNILYKSIYIIELFFYNIYVSFFISK